MTWAIFFGGLASIAAILGSAVYLVKLVNQKLSKTPDQINQDIDQQEQQNKQDAESSGRPL